MPTPYPPETCGTEIPAGQAGRRPTGLWAGREDPAGLTYRLRARPPGRRGGGEADVSLSSGAADLPGGCLPPPRVPGATPEARTAGCRKGGLQVPEGADCRVPGVRTVAPGMLSGGWVRG
jgi:hypothetical protein